MMGDTTRVPTMDKGEARAWLVEWFPKGSTAYTILRHVSTSGMQREIGVVALLRGRTKADGIVDLHPNYAVAAVLDMRLNERGDGIVTRGAGMDMGFDLIYSLSRVLYDDGYAISQRWL